MSCYCFILVLPLLVPAQVPQELPFDRSCLVDNEVTVHCVAISTDGKKLLVAGGSQKGGDWKVFALTTGKCLLNGIQGKIRCQAAGAACFSPDGSLFAMSGGTRLFLLESATGNLLWDLTKEGYNPGRLGDIDDLCITSDNRYLISMLGSRLDKTLRIWDIRKRNLHTVIQFVETELNAQDRITVEKGENTERFYYVVGKCEGLYRILSSPDGKTIAIAGKLDGRILLLDLATGKVAKTIDTKQRSTFSFEFTRDGKWLVAGGRDGMIEIWDVEKNHLVKSIGKHDVGVEHVAISLDKKTILSGGSNDGFRVWDVGTGKQKYSYFSKGDPRVPKVKIAAPGVGSDAEQETRSAGCAFLADGKTFLIAPYTSISNTEIYFHDITNGRLVDYRKRALGLTPKRGDLP